MAHAHERTLLSKLGFADADKREPEHDLACEYVATNKLRMIELFGHRLPSDGMEVRWDDCPNQYVIEGDLHSRCKSIVTREKMISKGVGRYQSTIGFMDVHIGYEIDLIFLGARKKIGTRTEYSGCEPIVVSEHDRLWDSIDKTERGEWRIDWLTGDIGVEVKATHQSVGDVIRQIQLYRAHTIRYRWILATCYPICDSDLSALKNEGIRHIYLGERFQAWKKIREAKPAVMAEL